MEANKTLKLSSFKVLTIVALIILLSNPNVTSACDDNSLIPTNSTKSKIDYTSTNVPSKSKSNYNDQSFKNYILTSCNSTTYPSICYKTLSPYATKIQSDPLKLCSVSLSLALKAAKSASSTISKILKKNNNFTKIAEQVMQDCFGNVKDSIGELKDSLGAIEHLGGVDRKFQISNIKTWVSASITNDETCSDGFDEMNVDSTLTDQIRKLVLDVARKTSNALYFINNNVY